MARKGQETSRERRKRKPKPVVVIVCEGSKTEPAYFQRFRSRYVNIRIEVEGNKASGSKTDFYHLVRKAVSKKMEYLTSTEGDGCVWCVFDADVDYNTPNAASIKNKQLHSAIQEAKANEIAIALSNPCFELWFLLHYEYSTGHMKNYDDVHKKLSAYIPQYDKSDDVYSVLLDKLNCAIQNAKKLKQHHNENGKKNLMDVSATPYTNVWELVEGIQQMNS